MHACIENGFYICPQGFLLTTDPEESLNAITNPQSPSVTSQRFLIRESVWGLIPYTYGFQEISQRQTIPVTVMYVRDEMNQDCYIQRFMYFIIAHLNNIFYIHIKLAKCFP